MKFSPQQRKFIDWAQNGEGSCVLEAVAGAGKTTTLIAAIERLDGEVAVLAYNKKIAEEIKEKLSKNAKTRSATAGTVHSFGFSAYRRAFKNTRVERNKMRDLLEREIPPHHDLAPYASMIGKLVSLAKQRAIGCNHQSIANTSLWVEIANHFDVFDTRDDNRVVPEDAIIEAAKAMLVKSNKQTDIIDFDDMVYMPLVLGLPFHKYDVVMVDEAQDTNPARRLLVTALLKKGGRVIAVGDRHQAIYGFTGADNDSLDLIADAFNCIRLPLTTTYRCPKNVVAFAQQWVSHIHAHESAPVGSVTSTGMADFIKRKDLNGNSAVLCRNVKPLISMALALIRHRIACKVEGRDIAAQLTKLIKRWKVKSLHALSDKLDAYLEQQRTRLLEKRLDGKVQTLEDTVEAVRVIVDQCLSENRTTIQDAVDFVDALFADDVKGMLVLSTIHKSKGREWERVFWLDRAATCPSKYAKQEWQKQQEVNLMYVAATRAKNELIELSGDANNVKVEPVSTPVAKGPKMKEQLKAEKRARAKARRTKAKEQIS